MSRIDKLCIWCSQPLGNVYGSSKTHEGECREHHRVASQKEGKRRARLRNKGKVTKPANLDRQAKPRETHCRVCGDEIPDSKPHNSVTCSKKCSTAWQRRPGRKAMANILPKPKTKPYVHPPFDPIPLPANRDDVTATLLHCPFCIDPNHVTLVFDGDMFRIHINGQPLTMRDNKVLAGAGEGFEFSVKNISPQPISIWGIPLIEWHEDDRPVIGDGKPLLRVDWDQWRRLKEKDRS